MEDTSATNGLNAAEAARRLAADGPNSLPAGQRRTILHIIWGATREPMFLLLFGSALLYLVLGELQEGIFLFAMVLVTVTCSCRRPSKSGDI